jgi:hypothetical protein
LAAIDLGDPAFFTQKKRMPMRHVLTLLLLCLLCAIGSAKPVPKRYVEQHSAIAEDGVIVPAGVPLKVRLIAKQAVYQLDRDGLSEDAYRKQLDLARITGQLPAAPKVDLVFELENTGKEEVQILVGGDVAGSLRLRLQGPGAVSVTYGPTAETDDFKPAAVVKIPAGGTHRWAFKELDCSGARDQSRVYWTQGGEYQLSAGFTVAMKPAPKGAVNHWYHKDHGNVAISSGAVKITVIENK